MLHHEYINNEINLESKINQHEELFENFIDNPPSLKEALFQMFNSSRLEPIKSNSLYNQIISKVDNHLNNKFSLIRKKYPKSNITYEDAQIISTYTCELNKKDHDYCPYKILNTNLVLQDRKTGIKNISKFLFLFLKALRKLDRYPDENENKNNKQYLYRCINSKVELNYDSFNKQKIPYLKGKEKIFWAFSSASTNPQTALSFLGKNENNNKTGTIFTLTGNIWGYDITLFNVFNEEEILIEPERKIIIKESIPPVNDVIYVRCKVLESPLILENIFKQLDFEDNLNIGQIINEKNKENEIKNNIINMNIFPSSTKNKNNNQKFKFDNLNSEPNPLKSKNLFKNKHLKNSNSLNNFFKNNKNKFNTIDNSDDINKNKKNIFFNNKKQFSININNNLNDNQIFNINNIGNIKENNKKNKFFKSEKLFTEPTQNNFNSSLKNNNKQLFSSSSHKNCLSDNKFNTIDNDNNIKNGIITIGYYKVYLNDKFPSAKITYYGINTKSEEEVAIKIEQKSLTENSSLFLEQEIYKSLKGEIGVPKLIWVGTQGKYNILVRELLGRSLEDYFKLCKNKFTLLTTLTLVDQMISRIESYHKKNYIFCNIKPSQFLMGRYSMKYKVYIIPSHFSKRYIDPNTGLHIPYKEGLIFNCTPQFASINQLKGIEASRRDDIEALGYILVYFFKGNLPWQNETVINGYQIKINTSLDDLCESCPEEFKTFIKYARGLKFEETPNYDYLRILLKQIRNKNNLTINYKYDWL